MIGAAIERKGWLVNNKGRLFPNQYILLVGPAGVGKSLCTNLAYDMLSDIRTPETPFHIAPTSVTRASLVDCLAAADRRIVRLHDTPAITSFNSLTAIVDELGVFLPAWDGEFMSFLTHLWDNKQYAETRRTKAITIDIPNTQLNLLSATTPAYLNSLLPEGAWEFGFMSRIINIYSGEEIYTDIFAELDHDSSLYKNLVGDLKDIYSGWGQFTVTDDVKIAVNAWAREGGRPYPDHPKLSHYKTRRLAHLLKLCMIASASTDNDRVITLEHYAEALDWLTEAETFMPDIFKAMKTGGDQRVIEECYHFVYLEWMKKKEPVSEHLVYTFLSERVPAHSVQKILDVMVATTLLKKQYMNSGGQGYEPKARKA